jgi:hypothetical protein
MIHPDSKTVTETALSENMNRESPPSTLHLYTHPGARTFCGRKFLKLSRGVSVARADDFFGEKPLMVVEKLCEKCEATLEYKERYGLWLLARVGEE